MVKNRVGGDRLKDVQRRMKRNVDRDAGPRGEAALLERLRLAEAAVQHEEGRARQLGPK